ncbi:MAG: 2-isopropylmalate synthase, partial [Kosmotogaceae bacterium]
TYTASDGFRYEGDWKEGIPTGHAVMTYKDGRKYIGYNNNFVRMGPGKMYDRHGNLVYDGGWLDDEKHGSGTLFDKNGKII